MSKSSADIETVIKEGKVGDVDLSVLKMTTSAISADA